MIEGGGSDDFATRAHDGRRAPGPAATGSSTSTRARSPRTCDEQIVAGADAVMIFDTWGGMLCAARRTGAIRSRTMRERARRARAATRRRARCRRSCSPRAAAGGSTTSPRAARTPWGSTGPSTWPPRARAHRRSRRAAGQSRSARAAHRRRRPSSARPSAVVDAAGPAPGHVFNLGHGIVPATPPEHVAVLVEAVPPRARSASEHSGLDNAAATCVPDATYAHRGIRGARHATARPSCAHGRRNYNSLDRQRKKCAVAHAVRRLPGARRTAVVPRAAELRTQLSTAGGDKFPKSVK